MIDTDEGRVVLAYGRVVLDDTDVALVDEQRRPGSPDLAVPPTRAEADELMLVSRWLQQTRNVRCHDATGIAASRLPAIAGYTSRAATT